MAQFQNLADLAAQLYQASVNHDENTFMALLQESDRLNAAPAPENPEPAVSLQAQQRPRMPEPPKPEFFSGADGKPPLVRTWLFQLRQYFRLWPNMPDSKKINFAVTLLRAHAMNWWEQQEQLIRLGTAEDVDTFEKFEEAITKQFGGFDTVERARDILANMRQVSSVETYVRRFREALLLLGADNYLDADMCHQFILGLKPWIQKISGRPPTLGLVKESASGLGTRDRIVLHGRLAGALTTFLVDSGAGANAVSTAFLDKHGLRTSSSSHTGVHFADGSQGTARGQLRATSKLDATVINRPSWLFPWLAMMLS
jgi:hypothetical protein